MDLKEYYDQLDEFIKSSINAHLVGMYTSLVGIVQEDSDGHTCVVQPSIKGRVTDIKTGETKDVSLPIIKDIPVKFAGGGGTVFTHPIKKGDEILLVFNKQAIDTWHQNGGEQVAIDTRRHDISDAIAIPGLWSTPRKIQNISTTSSQMRSVDGKHFVDMHPQNGLTLKSELQVTLHAPAHTIKGDLTVQPTEDGKGGNVVIKQISGQGGTLKADKSVGAPALSGTVGPPETTPPILDIPVKP